MANDNSRADAAPPPGPLSSADAGTAATAAEATAAGAVESAAVESRVIELETPDQHRRMLEVYAEVFGASKARRLDERFAWQYREHPARRPGRPTNFLLFHGGDDLRRVVGHMGVMPVRMQAAGKKLQGGWGCDLLVHPAARRSAGGPGLTHFSAALDDAAELPMSYGMTDVVARLYERRGYCRLAIGSYLALFNGFVGAWRSGRGLRRLRNVLKTRPGAPSVDPPSDLPSEPPPDADDLWFRIAPDYPFSAVRDSAYLRYRYVGRYPARFLEIRDDGKLQALAVLEMFRRGSARAGQISELLVPRSDATLLLPRLLDLAVEILRRQDVDLILTEGFPEDLRRILRSYGFHALDPQRREILIVLDRNIDAADRSRLADPDCWLLTPGDSDRSLAYPRLPWRSEAS